MLCLAHKTPDRLASRNAFGFPSLLWCAFCEYHHSSTRRRLNFKAPTPMHQVNQAAILKIERAAVAGLQLERSGSRLGHSQGRTGQRLTAARTLGPFRPAAISMFFLVFAHDSFGVNIMDKSWQPFQARWEWFVQPDLSAIKVCFPLGGGRACEMGPLPPAPASGPWLPARFDQSRAYLTSGALDCICTLQSHPSQARVECVVEQSKRP